MNLLPKNEWLDGEDLVGKLMNTFWDDRKMSVDIRDLDDYYEVKADLPGFEKEEISVHYSNDLLSIDAEHTAENEVKDDGRFVRRERSSSAYRRQFVVKNIIEEKISAKFKNGVLTLQLPKADDEEKKNKAITID
ncbi:Hsp20/alpha crystallin family protein [Enterococcus dongliensis]|uniref:Hsp20/alpha crystallin family protein n=1 Tax=Enterococcus dongliensis TaxID=2559925 RepID=A0AAP5KT17_9ENTE|nr:Hsp20/alpha crystallin family protein [Enterococcus dongliensis]MDT2597597.1 Hsp20/alpha crystallin family protein [Enterococcus dongliensis]MDT2603692.1 Hsp20/alpha crystallin family protein [Enterococcus dongliensis]MDT2634153.1 Hsp20/alpha crystallin family protein [Enterococcus dongliensis]MDT2637083.1 Hsp20/alpha crystallin family protein [Enterococcus dongliensis]MDT2642368.1 Hsp20/alpha crystallin family protein [Enterococcus dongliensis]